jgi:hypothetical protein
LDGDRLVPFTQNARQKAELISALTVDNEITCGLLNDGGGLFRVAHPRFSNWGQLEGLRGPMITSVFDDNEGGAWTIGYEGLSHVSKIGKVRQLPVS